MTERLTELDKALLAFAEEIDKWQGDGDVEIAHHEADDILCKVLYEIANHTDNQTTQDLIRLITKRYENIDKWYA